MFTRLRNETREETLKSFGPHVLSLAGTVKLSTVTSSSARWRLLTRCQVEQPSR